MALGNCLEPGICDSRASAVRIVAHCGRAASIRRSESPLLLGTRRMRLQHLHVENAGQFAIQLRAQLREGAAPPVSSQFVRAAPLLDHDQPVLTFVQGIQPAAFVFGVDAGDGGLHGGDNFRAVLRMGIYGRDNDGGHGDPFRYR